MNGEKIKVKYFIVIISSIIIILIALFIIIIGLKKNKNQIYTENNNQIYKIKLTINLVDNNGKNDIIFSDNNISGVRVTGVDLYSPSIFIIRFNEIEGEKLKGITRNNIGNIFLLYYNNQTISSLEITEEINTNQLLFENIDDEISLDIINNIFEKE